MNAFPIRRATVDDASGITNVKYRSWQDTYRGIISDSYLDAMSIDQLKTTWQQILSPQNTATVTDLMTNNEGEIIGYICYGKNDDPAFKATSEVYALYLLKSYHGKGLGATLFLKALSQQKSFVVRVLVKNPALSFYRKFKPDQECLSKVEIDGIKYDEMVLVWNQLRPR